MGDQGRRPSSGTFKFTLANRSTTEVFNYKRHKAFSNQNHVYNITKDASALLQFSRAWMPWRWTIVHAPKTLADKFTFVTWLNADKIYEWFKNILKATAIFNISSLLRYYTPSRFSSEVYKFVQALHGTLSPDERQTTQHLLFITSSHLCQPLWHFC